MGWFWVLRKRRLLDLARNAPCMLQIPDICNFDPTTTVACHSNLLAHGHGTGVKSHDCFIAFGCSACHSALDDGSYSREDKEYWFRRGMDGTLLYLWDQGLIDVA